MKISDIPPLWKREVRRDFCGEDIITKSPLFTKEGYFRDNVMKVIMEYIYNIEGGDTKNIYQDSV
jgi:hypothetical protein